MLRFLADEHIDPRIVSALHRLDERIDCVTVQGVGLRTKSDAEILEWAAQHDYIVVSHDYATMSSASFDRLSRNLRMPGLILMRSGVSIGAAARYLCELASVSDPKDLDAQVLFAQM